MVRLVLSRRDLPFLLVNLQALKVQMDQKDLLDQVVQLVLMVPSLQWDQGFQKIHAPQIRLSGLWVQLDHSDLAHQEIQTVQKAL